MQKKIVFFDIDGTIYSYEKGVIEDTKQAIREIRNKGHLAVLCTGRTVPMITDDILEIGFDGIIAGAGTYVEYEGRVLYKSEIDEEAAKELISAMKRNGFLPVGEGHEGIYFEELGNMEGHYRKAYEIYNRMVPDRILKIGRDRVNIAKISGAFTDNSHVYELKKELKDRYTMVNHGNELMEVIPVNHSKADGIKKLISEIGIEWENTYAFGDSFNDLEMLKYVKYGIAMGNSDKDLFAHVKYRTGNYDRGGVREALERHGLL